MCVEGWLLVETGRGGMGARTYWCVATLTHVRWWMESQVPQLSLIWENSHSVRDMVSACTDLEYINPIPSSVVVGYPPT